MRLIVLQLVYHGLTSLAQGSTLSDDPQPPILDGSSSRSAHETNANANTNANTDANSLIEPSFAPFFQALAASKHVSVAPEIGNALLDCFFCYSSPLYNVVQRSIFLRTQRIASHRIAAPVLAMNMTHADLGCTGDMALGGPFFSEFLLMTLYASGTRMIDGLGESDRRAQGDLFAKLARDLLVKEMEEPSKITAIRK